MSQVFNILGCFVAQIIKFGLFRPIDRACLNLAAFRLSFAFLSLDGAILTKKSSKTADISTSPGAVPTAGPEAARPKKRAKNAGEAVAKGPHGGARPGSGRKPGMVVRLPVVGKLRRWVTFRIRPDDRAILERAARASGWRVGRFARIASLERAQGEHLVVMDAGERQLFARALDELKRQGSNLNQIAFAANKVAKGLGRPSEMPAAEALAETGRDVKAIVDTLGALLAPVVRRMSDAAHANSRRKAPARADQKKVK